MKALSVEPRQPELPAQPVTDPAGMIRHHIADLQSIRGAVGAHPLTLEQHDAPTGIREPEAIAPVAHDADRSAPWQRGDPAVRRPHPILEPKEPGTRE